MNPGIITRIMKGSDTEFKDFDFLSSSTSNAGICGPGYNNLTNGMILAVCSPTMHQEHSCPAWRRLFFWAILPLLLAGCQDGGVDIKNRISTNAAHVTQTFATNHILIIDVSPSMAPYLPAVRQSIQNAIRGASSGDVMSVYIFWHDIKTVVENIEIDRVDRNALIQQIESSVVRTEGCTDVARMLEFSREKMLASERLYPFHRKMLMIFSDNQHAPYPCGGGRKLSAPEESNLESKAGSVRRMGGWSKYVIYTPVTDKKEANYNKLPSDIGAKRIEYTNYKDADALKGLVSVTKWILILQMLAVALLFVYFVFRLYALNKLLFVLGLFLLIFLASTFLVEMLTGIDYLNSSIELFTGKIINYLSPVIGDHRIVMPLQLTFSIMTYLGIWFLIRKGTTMRPKAAT
jgi:hypothetical protein